MAIGRPRQPERVDTKSVVDYQADALNIQGLRQLGQRRELDLVEQEMRIKDSDDAKRQEAEFEELFQRHGGDIEAAWPEMLAINPRTAMAIRQMEDQHRRDAGASLRQHLENEMTMRRQSAQILDELDEGSWADGQSALANVDPQLAQSMPEQYDPEWVEAQVGMSMTERESLENEMQGLTEIMSGEMNRGYARWLGRARDVEEYASYVESARQMGIPESIINQYPTSMPDQETLDRIRQAGMDPRDQAAMDRTMINAELEERRLAIMEEQNRINELRYLQTGSEDALRNLFGNGTPRAALWNLEMMDMAKEYPDGEFPPEEVRERAERLIELTGGSAAGEGVDDVAMRAGGKVVTDWMMDNPEPPPDAPQEEWDNYNAELQRVARAAMVAARQVSLSDLAGGGANRPYVGERGTAYETMNPQTRQRIEGLLRQANLPATPANVEQFLRDNPGIEEGVMSPAQREDIQRQDYTSQYGTPADMRRRGAAGGELSRSRSQRQ